jgi:hypothetical protein
LRTLLGVDVVDGHIVSKPCESKRLGAIRLEGVEVRGSRVDIP